MFIWLNSNYQKIMVFYHFYLVIIILGNSVLFRWLCFVFFPLPAREFIGFEIKIDKHNNNKEFSGGPEQLSNNSSPNDISCTALPKQRKKQAKVTAIYSEL